MIKSIRLKLTIISTIATGMILILVSLFALSLYQSALEKQSQAAFESASSAILYKIQADNYITHSFLARFESSNRILISIYDNGAPLSFKGAWSTKSDRSMLIEIAIKEALEIGIDIKSKPLYATQTLQAFFSFKAPEGDIYRAAAFILPISSGSRSLIVIGDTEEESAQAIKLLAIFVIISIIGLLGIFLTCWWFSGHALKPVESARIKQAEFIASASHELRSPLAVVRALASAERAQNSAHIIDSECSRMGRLIDDLSLIATADAALWSIKKQPIQIDTLLIELYDQFMPLAEKSGHKLNIDLTDELNEIILCDAERLTQTLAIFIDNAIAHTEKETTIVISPLVTAKKLFISISDNGAGIDLSEQERIFDSFYRIDKSRTNKKHFGLGLSIAKELCSLQGHSLSLKSQPGKGTIFTVEIPLKQKGHSKNQG